MTTRLVWPPVLVSIWLCVNSQPCGVCCGVWRVLCGVVCVVWCSVCCVMCVYICMRQFMFLYVSTLKHTCINVLCFDPSVIDDYLPLISFTMTFSNMTPQQTVCVPIKLIDDNTVEATESFQVVFDAVTPGVVIGSPDITTIFIEDNDGILVLYIIQNCT